MTTTTHEAPEGERPRRVRRKTGSYAAADGRREAILETAITHFAQWGYFNSSIPKIASDVGISRAGLLHHFADKEALLEAVIRLRERRAAERFFIDIETTSTDPAELFDGIAAQAEFNESEPGLTQMFSVLSAESSNDQHPAHDYFRNRYERIAEFISSTLARCVDAGTVEAGTDPDEVAREILAASDGFAIQWALAGPDFGLASHMRRYLDRLARDITPR